MVLFLYYRIVPISIGNLVVPEYCRVCDYCLCIQSPAPPQSGIILTRVFVIRVLRFCSQQFYWILNNKHHRRIPMAIHHPLLQHQVNYQTPFAFADPSRGTAGACPPPPPQTVSNSFIFTYVFTEKHLHQKSAPPNGSAPPQWLGPTPHPQREILDLPLIW